MSETPGSEFKPKAISSLAKKPSEVTRGGAPKLKFIPTLKRNKDVVKTEPKPDTEVVPPAPSNDRGHGRGRGRGEGRGRGRGGPRPAVEMVASGPFALGPATAGTSSSRRFTAATPIPVPSKSGPSSLGSGLSQSAAPNIKSEERRTKVEREEDDDEVYSDPDEGVEIIDMENVRDMDWMAPESVRKERIAKKPKKEDPDVETAGDINLANALNLSDSEEEEELNTIIDDFGKLNDDTEMNIDDDTRQFYFFQFPSPFPSYSANPPAKKVTFSPDVKSEVEAQASSATEIKEQLDGTIGHLEVYRSGAVKMRLANGILLDVNAGTQVSFLQHAVHLDSNESRLAVLGEITKRFVVTPDVDALLNAMDAAESTGPVVEGEENMISMDDT